MYIDGSVESVVKVIFYGEGIVGGVCIFWDCGNRVLVVENYIICFDLVLVSDDWLKSF